jgi:RNA polymerase sigma factor (sigma-70 family)
VNTRTDQQLLQDYAGNRSEAAFTELVRRHIDLVYSAALRMVCDSHQAQDVVQSVFVALAQNARQLIHHPVLSGWLHRTTQNLAANVIRTNVRRQAREQEAVAMTELLSAQSDATWEHIAPHLDAALGELNEADRDALLLRYFERQSAQEMAANLGISNEAAQKRVSRAVERLRDLFAQRGISVGAGGLVVAISANAVHAAPVALLATISATVLAGTTLTTAALVSQTTATTMNWINLKSAAALVAAALAAGTGTYVVQQQTAAGLRAENQKLVAAQQALTQERDAARAIAGSNADELKRRESDKTELMRLRGEIGQLRRKATEAEQLAEQNRQLQEAFNKLAQSISHPENQPEADPEKRFAIERLNEAKQLVLGLILYAGDHADSFPSDLNSISQYLGNAATNLLNDSFELVLQGAITNIPNPSATIAVSGRSPFIMNGKSVKVYGFADGHAEIKREPKEGFEAWEKARMMPRALNQ